MKKVLHVGYEYEAYYGNGVYEGDIYIPSDKLQPFVNIDLSVPENLESIAKGISKFGEIWLGEIEGKHSEVILRGDEITVEVLDYGGEIVLIDDAATTLAETLVDVLIDMKIYADPSSLDLDDVICSLESFYGTKMKLVHQVKDDELNVRNHDTMEEAFEDMLARRDAKKTGISLTPVEVPIKDEEI